MLKNKLLTTFINDTSTQSSLSVVNERWSSWKELTDIIYIKILQEFTLYIRISGTYNSCGRMMKYFNELHPSFKSLWEKKREKQSFVGSCFILNFMYVCGNKTHFSCINANSMSHFINLWIKRFLWGRNMTVLMKTMRSKY